jgi:hypothetical protein
VSPEGDDIERSSSEVVQSATSETVPMPHLPYDTRAYGLIYGDKFVLQYSRHKGDDAFFVSRGVNRKKARETFPLTLVGWRQAFAVFEQLEPAAAARHLRRAEGEIESEQLRRRVASAIGYMGASVYLGGHGVSLTPGKTYSLFFEADELLVTDGGTAVARIPYSAVHQMEISGRGEVTSGGGFIGGGFGVEGAVTGMAVAALLNAATTQTKMETVLQLEATDAEAFFHYGLAPPDRLRIELSAVFGRLRRERSHSGQELQPPDAELTDQLLKLADLRREGLLSPDEFEAAKRRLLGDK